MTGHEWTMWALAGLRLQQTEQSLKDAGPEMSELKAMILMNIASQRELIGKVLAGTYPTSGVGGP